MIEEIADVHAKVDRVPLGDPGSLKQAEIERRVPGAVENAPAESADGSGGRIEERLSREGRRAVRRHRAAVAAEGGGGNHVWTGAGHTERQDLSELIQAK